MIFPYDSMVTFLRVERGKRRDKREEEEINCLKLLFCVKMKIIISKIPGVSVEYENEMPKRRKELKN